MWLGQAHALVMKWRAADAMMLRVSSDMLGSFASTRAGHVGEILGTLHRAVADLELGLPTATQQTFGPSAIYDFFKALNAVVSSAQKSLLIVDPYMDEDIFDHYLSAMKPSVHVRLLMRESAAKLKPAYERFALQHATKVDARKSKALHDRVVAVDGSECWVVGQSIKDAAASKPTYLAPLSPDVATLKIADYETIWNAASAI